MKAIIRFFSVNILIALLVFSVSTNLGGNTSVEPQQSADVIIYALPFDFDEYSAFTAGSYATAQWNSAVYAALLKRSSVANKAWVPDLAINMPTVSPDGLTYTFTLKDGLKFSNGHNLTTSDVKFSFQAALNPSINPIFYGRFNGFFTDTSINVIGSLKVSFTLNAPYGFVLSILSFPIMDEEYFKSRYDSCLLGVGADCLWNDPSGSDVVSAGPFMVDNIDNVNHIVTVIANPYYYNFQNVATDKIIFQKIADKATAISALANGLIDILDATYTSNITELSTIAGASVDIVGGRDSEQVALNHNNPYYGSGLSTPIGISNPTVADDAALNVRKALSHIVDRNFIVNNIMGGLASPAATIMPPASLGWDSTLVPRNFSITTARNYMKAAGFNYTTLGTENPDGSYDSSFFNITVLSPNTNPDRNKWSANYVTELPKIGIGVTQHVSTGWFAVVPRTFGYSGGLPPSYVDGGYDVLFVSYGWGIDWNPGEELYSSSGRCDTGDCDNFQNFDLYENKTNLAQLVREYLGELDFDLRLQKVKLVQAEMYKWVPELPILSSQSLWGLNDEVTGIDSLLLSSSSQEWDLVKKPGFIDNTNLTPSTSSSTSIVTSSSGPTSQIVTITTTDSIGTTSTTPSVTSTTVTSVLSLSSPADITFVEGKTGKAITWKLEGSHPEHYEVYQDGNLIESDVWISGQTVTLNLDGLSVGRHEYVIKILDTLGDSAQDSVMITVIDSETNNSSDNTSSAEVRIDTNYLLFGIFIATTFVRRKIK